MKAFLFKKLFFSFLLFGLFNYYSFSQTQSKADTIILISSKVFNNTRALRVLLPPQYNKQEYSSTKFPVLYLNDGFSVFKSWGIKQTIYDLVDKGEIEPFILVGIDNAIKNNDTTTDARTIEYLPYPDSTEPTIKAPKGTEFPRFLTDEVTPLINKIFRTKPDAANTGIGGSSYGAISALYTYISTKNSFSKLLLESPPLFLFEGRLIKDAEESKTMQGKVYMGFGTKETTDTAVLNLIKRAGPDATEQLIEILKKRKIPYLFNLKEGAEHNAKAWGERFPDAIRFLYGIEK